MARSITADDIALVEGYRSLSDRYEGFYEEAQEINDYGTPHEKAVSMAAMNAACRLVNQSVHAIHVAAIPGFSFMRVGEWLRNAKASL